VTDATELEDLDTLTACPGWRRMEALFHKQWGMGGERFCEAIQRMANDTDKVKAAENMQLVMLVQRELMLFHRGIEARVADLKGRTVETVGSRRGLL
jgi:hypothetical protein